jgi:hypothetical protein
MMEHFSNYKLRIIIEFFGKKWLAQLFLPVWRDRKIGTGFRVRAKK